MVKAVTQSKEQKMRDIKAALDYLRDQEPMWKLETPIGKQSYIDEMFGRGAYAAYLLDLGKS